MDRRAAAARGIATIIPAMATDYPVLRWKVGDVAIARVVEIEGSSPGTFLFVAPTGGHVVRVGAAFRFVPTAN